MFIWIVVVHSGQCDICENHHHSVDVMAKIYMSILLQGVYTSENTKWKHKYMGILLLETSYVVHVGFRRFLA